MTQTYKGHHIQVLAWHIAERNGWKPFVHVTDYTASTKPMSGVLNSVGYMRLREKFNWSGF
jgi:hypothetical protein